ncbi:MAG: hypothetical protein EKK41_16325 [Hyphomicrobiales bacterium]|nr:MAG: hypothetical protein EKK41_16325 [Hyphomicrobiales bacterium]
MAEDRVSRIGRILKVQQQLHRAEEWRLAEIERQLEGFEAEQREIVDALNSESGLQSLFLDASVRRVRSLGDAVRGTEVEREAQSARVLETGSRLKAAERLMQRAESEARREEEDSQLQEAVERIAAQAPGKHTD